MTLYEQVISNLKGVIGSNKDGISINRINSEYEYITGTKLPLKDLNYNSTLSFIESLPKLFRIKYVRGCLHVFNEISANDSESNLTLFSLIMNTTNKKSNKFKSKPIFTKNSRYLSFNNGFQSNSQFSFNFKPNGAGNHASPFDNNAIRNNDGRGRYPLNPLNNRDMISDSESEYSKSNYPVSISLQTEEIQYKRISEPNGFFKPQDFISIIIDIIVEFKPLNLDNIVFFRIKTDLHYYFQLFTGLNIDSGLFRELVLGVLLNLDRTEMFDNQIYSDDTNRYCCLNLSSATNHTIVSLPHLEFQSNASFRVSVVSAKPNGIFAVKFADESSSSYSASSLRWTKSQPLSEQAKDIIQNQQFWSWIPGSVCLVRLPYAMVRALNIDSVERAVIVSTQIASPIEVKSDKSASGAGIVLHRATFYLIDHNRYVPNVLCSTSSFQAVKRATYRNNDTNVAYVCNLSIRARCQPAKIQFLKISNMTEVSQLFIGGHCLAKSLIVYQLRELRSSVRNCQPVYECCARLAMDVERGELSQYEVAVVRSGTAKKASVDSCGEEIEVIVISDSEDEVEIVEEKKVVEKKPDVVIITNGDVTNGIESAPPVGVEDDKISVISFTDDEIDLDGILNEDGDDAISISSSSDSNDDNASHSAPADNVDSNNEVVGTTTTVPVVMAEQQQQEQEQLEKCLVPISTTLCGQFDGKVVRMMHVQRGAAAICLLQSSGIIRREMLMLQMAEQELVGVLNCLVVGDAFMWCPTAEMDYIKTYNEQHIALVEILQVINPDTALAALVHYGLVVTVKRDELRHIPNPSELQELIGPIVGAFDLHMIPNWYGIDIDPTLANTLFTAFFVNDDQLVLEYFDQQGRFFNLDLISRVEENLTLNHCNIRSKSFISSLSDSLLACRLFVGNLLVLSKTLRQDMLTDCLPITKTLKSVTDDDEPGVWFVSVDIETESGQMIRKLSPHYFNEEKFCIDRVRYNKVANTLHLLDYQNIEIDVPEAFAGIYKFDQTLLTEFMKSNAEFHSRYMLFGAVTIPDLNCLFNKLIF